MDFTIQKYKELLNALVDAGYSFQTFETSIKEPRNKSIVLRHDVDLLPFNSLEFAQIQAKRGVRGTYYFRAVPESWDESVIKEIASLGHEIGYHYECLTTTNGNMELGIKDFIDNLEALRMLAQVKTICMHGSPLSKYDSKDLWKNYNYKEYDIIAEPYFDVDYNEVYYITDTGRKWNGHKTSVRDRVQTSFTNIYHNTEEIINAIKEKSFPDRTMFTFHPQRWNDNMFKWSKELVFQNAKNVIKKHFFVNQ